MSVRLPDLVYVDGSSASGRSGRWTTPSASVTAHEEPDGALRIGLATSAGVSRVVLRWASHPFVPALILGDAWERAYGDLQWRSLQPDRPLPWYWLGTTAGFGVRTRAGALCCWTVDEDGFTLWLDVRAGDRPVIPGDREIAAATVVSASGTSPFATLSALCAAMSPDPLLPATPVVGSNNWYYAYGEGFGPSAVLRDARTIASYAGDHPVRPYCVIDDGWTGDGGPWDAALFHDMPGLAADIRAAGARPGLWYRPLRHKSTVDASLPGTLDTVAADIRRFRDWGFELIKHDYSTFDVFGRFHAGGPAEMPGPGCTLADRSRTSAEVLVALYRTIADAAGDAVIIGCNTVGHLAAGLTHVQRVGDDTSGRHWERTRRMGINALAFRLAQHGRFYTVDADCVPCTPATDWSLNRQFLDLVARSGTALFVSVDPSARTPQADADLTAAVRRALDGGDPGGVEPLDWLSTTAPRHWRSGAGQVSYSWSEPWGASPVLPT